MSYPNWQGNITRNSTNNPNLIVSSIQTNGISTNTLNAKKISGNTLTLISDSDLQSYLAFTEANGNFVGGVFNGGDQLNIVSGSTLNINSQEKDIYLTADKGSIYLAGISSIVLGSEGRVNLTSVYDDVYINAGQGTIILDGDVSIVNISTGSLTADSAYIKTLSTNNLYTNYLSSGSGNIRTLSTNRFFTNYLSTGSAKIDTLSTNRLYTNYLSCGSLETLITNNIYSKSISTGSANIGTLSTNYAYLNNVSAGAGYFSSLYVTTLVQQSNINTSNVITDDIQTNTITVSNVATLNTVTANTTTINGSANLNGQVNLNADLYGATTSATNPLILPPTQQALKNINNINEVNCQSINVVGGWSGDDFFPPYHNASYVTIGDSVGITCQAIVTLNGELPDPANPGENLTTALTVRGDMAVDFGLLTTYNGLKCLPFNLAANALEVIGITYLDGVATVTGVFNTIGDANIGGVLETAGIANLNGGSLVTGGLLQVGGDVRFGDTGVKNSNSFSVWNETYLQNGLAVYGGTTTLNNPTQINNNLVVTSNLTAGSFNASSIHTSTATISTIYTTTLDANYNAGGFQPEIQILKAIQMRGNIYQRSNVIYTGGVVTDDIYTPQIHGNPYGTSINLGDNLDCHNVNISNVNIFTASTINCSNISTVRIITNSNIASNSYNSNLYSLTPGTGSIRVNDDLYFGGTKSIVASKNIDTLGISTLNINPSYLGTSIDFNADQYLHGNLHAESNVGYFGATVTSNNNTFNLLVSSIQGFPTNPTPPEVPIINFKNSMDLHNNNIYNGNIIATEILGSVTNPDGVKCVSGLDLSNNDVRYVYTLHTQRIQNDSGAPITLLNNLDVNSNDIQNGGQITGATVNAGSVNCDNIQPLTGSDINGNSGNLINFNQIKATTLYGDYIQAYTGSGITFNNSIDMNLGYITNAGNVNSDQVHVGTDLYVDSILTNSNAFINFNSNDVSNINNLYVTTGIETNLVYTNYLASSNGTIYLQTGTNLDGSTYQSLCNFNTVQGASASFTDLSITNISVNSAPNITISSDVSMASKNIKNITGLSSIYLSTGTIRANLISTNNLFVSSINNKQYPYTSTLNAPPSTFSYAASNTQSRTVPYNLYQNVTFPNAGWFNVSQKAIFTRASGTADTHQSILYTPGAFISTPSIKDGYAALPYTNQNNSSTFTTLTTELYISTTQLNRNIVLYNDTNNNFVGNLFMDRLVATYNPSRGYSGE
jgi:hypothetical protein